MLRASSLLLLVCLAMLVACERAPENTLRVGMELAYPPFEMSDEQGQPKGVSVDLARALGAELGRPVEIVNLPFDGLIPSLKTGKIDVILSSMTATEERAKSVDFSAPYLKTGLCLLVGAKSATRSVEDLKTGTQTVAVKKGTTGHLYAQEHFPGRFRALDREGACVLEVVQGKADAFIYDQISTVANWSRNPETTRGLLQPFQREGWAMAVQKGNEALRNDINAFLLKYRAAGGFERLGDTWLAKEKELFAQQGVEFVF